MGSSNTPDFQIMGHVTSIGVCIAVQTYEHRYTSIYTHIYGTRVLY
jgi:hypothetical protein